MKQFFKMMIASSIGVFLALMIMGFLALFSVGAMIAAMGTSETTAYVPKADRNILKVSLNGSLSDTNDESPFAALMSKSESFSLKDLLTAIKNAKEQETIKGIYLDVGRFMASSASIDAVRRALVDFQSSGKFVVAYGDQYTQSGYYLASVADKVYMNPLGMLSLTGLSSETVFYKGFLKKVGVEMMVFKVGTYKGAVEPFLLDRLSEENKKQIVSYTSGVWSNITRDIAKSRKIAVVDINNFADEGLFFADPEKAIDYGLIDGLKYRSDVETYLKEQAEQTGERIKCVSVSKMKLAKKKERDYKNKIAIIYAEGAIVEEELVKRGYDAPSKITQQLGNELRKLQDQDEVKAVVIRVNSPGGSAFVSDQIWKQVVDLKAKKPVVVSMGSMAASGGYYISCGASKIVAESNTLTGSIGIFGLFPNYSGAFHKLDLTRDNVKTNRFADIGNPSRLMSEEEKILIQAYIEKGYDTFISRCAAGRGLSKEQIDSVGQGRVWMGSQALAIGLVDELGGLDRAVEIAAELADVYNYNLEEVVYKKDFFDDLFNKHLEDAKTSLLRSALGVDYDEFVTLRDVRQTCGIQARMPYDLKPL